MDKKIKFITVATEDYHNYMMSFLLSFLKQCSQFKDLVSFKLYLINYSEEKCNELHKFNLNIEFVLENHIFKDKLGQSCFCTNYRYSLLNDNFDYKNVICWIDCDSLFMGDCSNVFNVLVSNSNGIFLYEKDKVWKFKGEKYKTLMGGFIGVNNTINGEAFVREYRAKVEAYINKNKNKHNEWWANQHVLRIMMKKNSNDFDPYFFREPTLSTAYDGRSMIFFKDEKNRKHKEFNKIAGSLLENMRNIIQ